MPDIKITPLAQMIARARELHVIARKSALDKAATPEERAELERRFATADSMARNRKFTVDPDPLGGE